jgi:hypothetical protein
VVEYPEDGYALAMNSAPVSGRELRLAAATETELTGCLVLLPDQSDPGRWLDRLVQAGAAGFAGWFGGDPDARARVELVRHAGILAGFSLTADEMAALRLLADVRGRAFVQVDVAHTGSLPIVTGRLPGASDAEILIVSHLCHPAPGANDNAAGVAAALEIARLIAARTGGLRVGIRWLWTAEIVGSAAYLWTAPDDRPDPLGVICLDMVGSDPAESCLIVEEGPEENDSVLLAAIAESVDQATRSLGPSYNGSIALPARPWALTPFAGASDHVLFADPSCGSSVVQLGHWPDPWRHSSADTADRVSADEVSIVAAAVCAALAHCYFGGGPAGSELLAMLQRHHLRRLQLVLSRTSQAALATPGWRMTDAAHVPAYADICDAFTSWRGSWTPTGHPAALPTGRAALHRRWPGPFNLRRLPDLTGPEEPAWYSKAVALAMSVDGRRDAVAVIAQASWLTGLDIAPAWAHQMLRAMAGAGWISEGPTPPDEGGRS